MKKLLTTVLLAVIGLAASAQTTLRVEVPNVVAADEQFNVTFILEGENSPSDFTWEHGEDFQLVWGPQTGRSTSIQIINGKRTKSSKFTYTYVMMPKKTGKFSLPAAVANVKGQEISSGQFSVEVVGGGASADRQQDTPSASQPAGTISEDDLFMRLVLNRSSVVVGEPVEATLKLYQRLNIAGFEDARFPSFNGFWSQEVEAPTNIEFRRESLDDKIYNTAVLRKYILIPQQTGTITIDPAELVCLVNIRVASTVGSSIFDGFFGNDYRTVRKRVSTSPIKVNVSPLPAGAPASFGGGVGKFDISARLSKDSLATHEAASLIVTVKGSGNISLLEAPKVSFPPDVEVYDTKITENIDKRTGATVGSKVYEYPFIPRSYGDFEIPSIKYSYYDIAAGRYVTKETGPIAMSVAKGKETTGGYSAVPSSPAVGRSGVRNLNEDIRFISTKLPAFSSKGEFFVLSGLFWCLAAALLVLASALYLAFRKIAARRADVAGMKNRKATKMALRRLRLAGDFLRQNLYTAFYEELHKAMLGFASDKLNVAAGDLSKERIADGFGKMGVDAAMTERFVSIIDACEFARYSPDAGHEAMSRHYDEAVNVISSIDTGMKGKNRAMKSSALALLLMLSLPFTASAADSAETGLSNAASADSGRGSYVDELWNEGVKAYSDGEWENAVASFGKISEMGLESAQLYCNIGDAYFKAGDYPHAILYYERTLKLDPSYSDAKYNLGILSGLIQDRIDPVPEFVLKAWTRSLCYTLDSDSWAVLFIVFLALMLSMVLLFLLGSSTGARRTGFYTAIAFLLLAGASLGFSLWQRNDYMKADSAIVTRPVSSVKSSPSSEASTDLFILHEGTKVNILDEVGDWRNIELADGRQGWMRIADMEVI